MCEEKKSTIEIEVTKNTCSIWDKVKEYYQEKELSVLEIGVFRAGQIRKAYSVCNIKSYVGIDPYLGTSDDSYKGAYWKDEVAAFQVYQESKEIFEGLGGQTAKNNIRNLL